MSNFVKAENVYVNQNLASREAVLQFLSKAAVKANLADDEEAVLKAYHEREAMGETGMQDGFAIPHAKTDAIREAGVVVVKLTAPVEWPSFDGQPVDICIALNVPNLEAGSTHIKLLSATAVLLMDDDFRDTIRKLDDPQAIADLINAGL